MGVSRDVTDQVAAEGRAQDEQATVLDVFSPPDSAPATLVRRSSMCHGSDGQGLSFAPEGVYT
jgi:hypothetical protein